MSIPADAVLGIDLGTSLVKAGIYSFDGTMQATAIAPIRSGANPEPARHCLVAAAAAS